MYNRATLYHRYVRSLFEHACLYVRVFVSGRLRTRLDLTSGTLMPGMDGASLAKERNPRLWPAGLKRGGTATSVCQNRPLSLHNWTVFSPSVLKHSRCFVRELLRILRHSLQAFDFKTLINDALSALNVPFGLLNYQ